MKVTEQHVEEFVKGYQTIVDEYHKVNGYNWVATLSIMYGKKYARIVEEDHGSRSVKCFVDLSNGDILKASGWKAPAKHARGNIFDESQGLGAIDKHGFIKYLR